jgi:hypothetical protein
MILMKSNNRRGFGCAESLTVKGGENHRKDPKTEATTRPLPADRGFDPDS